MTSGTSRSQMNLDQIKEVEISIYEKLNSLKNVPSSPSIFKVPECIRKGKEEFYTPSVVSIGPIHYKHPPLAPLQEIKLRHLIRFLGMIGDQYTLQDYIKMIGDMEEDIRDSYGLEISLSSNELIELVLLDATFIIYFIIGMKSPLDFEPIEDKLRLLTLVTQDLLLLENQLPFFVLECLFNKAFKEEFPEKSLADCTCHFLSSSYIPGVKPIYLPATSNRLTTSPIKHLLHLLWICCLPSVLREEAEVEPDISEYPLSASNLSAAGVKIRPSNSINLLDISYKDGVLEIPKFTLLERTELVFRNLLAYEQCLHIGDSYFLDYLTFLDHLVDTSGDFKILMENGIFKNWLGDIDKALYLFNGMTINSVFLVNKFYYKRLSKDLNAYAKIPCHNWMAVLRRDYFSHPWAIISVIYAIVLLVLTILQVITGFKSS